MRATGQLKRRIAILRVNAAATKSKVAAKVRTGPCRGGRVAQAMTTDMVHPSGGDMIVDAAIWMARSGNWEARHRHSFIEWGRGMS